MKRATTTFAMLVLLMFLCVGLNIGVASQHGEDGIIPGDHSVYDLWVACTDLGLLEYSFEAYVPIENSVGVMDGVEFGETAAWFMENYGNGEYTAQNLLRCAVDWGAQAHDHPAFESAVLGDGDVRPVASNLYGFFPEAGTEFYDRLLSEGRTFCETEEYYRFEVVAADGTRYDVVANAGGEYNGGEWLEYVLIDESGESDSSR